jgi:predicted site-specific integrase-resolvase
VVIINPSATLRAGCSEQPLNFEEELVQDVLEIITVFSARLYGSRSRKTWQLVETLRAAAQEL